MLTLYKSLMKAGTPAIRAYLKRRCRKGKEDPERLPERMGIPSLPRPEGDLLWIHGASVGEAQSALILVETLQKKFPGLHIMITSGTLTSARLMARRLPKGAFHQFVPVDHPDWVAQFLDYWTPQMAIWMESELWPGLCLGLRERGIPAALINARMSERSFARWRKIPAAAAEILSAFTVCIAQNDDEAARYKALGANNVEAVGNIKYSARPLPVQEHDLDNLRKHVGARPVWLYASTHDGEEALACRLHQHLKKDIPDILTILVPRHPERGDKIRLICENANLRVARRGPQHHLPAAEDDIYLADTLGELGLFYRFSPLACIGRSFSRDGGGGHNPIEAAQLGCAVLHGPHVQFQADLYREMDNAGAALQVASEDDFYEILLRLLQDEHQLEEFRSRAEEYARGKAGIAEKILSRLEPVLAQSGLRPNGGDDHYAA